MKHEKIKAPDYPPRSLESFRVRERHEISDEMARYHAEYNRIRREHDDRIEEIKSRYFRESNAWLQAKMESAS